MTLLRSMLTILIWSIVIASPAQNAQPIFSLTISTPQSTFISGAEVHLTVELKNISNKAVYVYKDMGADVNADFINTLEVLDAKGVPVPDTALGRWTKVPGDPHHPKVSYGSGYHLELKPGDAMTESGFVNRLHDVTLPGSYTVQAIRDIPSEQGGGTIKSNIIKITVTR
jgi:hypothetical protein